MKASEERGRRADAPMGDHGTGEMPSAADALKRGDDAPRCGRTGFRAGDRPCSLVAGHAGPCSWDS